MSCLSLRTFFFIADPQSVHLKKFSLLPEYRRYYKKLSLIRNKDKNNVMISLLISLCHEMVLTYITQKRIIVYLCLAPILNIFINNSAAEELGLYDC